MAIIIRIFLYPFSTKNDKKQNDPRYLQCEDIVLIIGPVFPTKIISLPELPATVDNPYRGRVNQLSYPK